MKDKQFIRRAAGTIFRNGFIFRNPVIIGALGMYQVVAAGYNLKNAVTMSVLFLLITLPAGLAMCFIGMALPDWVRPGVALAVSALFYIPAVYIMDNILPGSVNSLGLAAALMISNSAVYSRVGEYAPAHVAVAVLADIAGNSAGFAAVACITSVARELWLTGGVWGTSGKGIGGGFSYPFAGFIVLGVLAAVVQWINLKRTEKYAERKRR